ncbi:MAG: gephyrin-like molybdotransferase Glp [Cyanobacteria bacterium P01_H01_bin.15]
MLSVAAAERLIFGLVKPLEEQETVALTEGLDRILAVPVVSDRNFPYWDNSAMDGYALRAKDVGKYDSLEIVGEIPAGTSPAFELAAGQAARIFTGAMLPEGADAIAMQEDTVREGNRVKFLGAVKPGQFVRRQGAFYQAGQPLIPAGIRISPADLAVLATAQCTQLPVLRRPRVAIFSTGDELITPEETLQPGQIIDSNSYALSSFVKSLGCIPLPLGIVRDEPGGLRSTIQSAIANADVVLSTGGVSVGEYDFVDQTLAELGGEIHIRKVAIKPGKPLTVATFKNRCLYFGIPGNPVSALVSCWRFVGPALNKLAGLRAQWEPRFIQAKTKQELRAGGQRETYLWGQLSWEQGLPTFSLAGGAHNSGNLMNLSQTTGLAVVPVGETVIPADSLISVLWVED